MRLIRHYAQATPDLQGGVVALGNFDGVHRGHQAVIRTAGEQAKALGALLMVMTFEPHPRLLFHPTATPFRLTSFRTKARLIEMLGVDVLCMQQFDRTFASITALDFVQQVLAESLKLRHIVSGYDYTFGKNRQGSADLLSEMARERGIGMTIVPPVSAEDGTAYASTQIRAFLSHARLEEAARFLGHYWEIEGRVEVGDRRGRTLGFPTANLHLRDSLRPPTGVYAVRAGLDQGSNTIWHDGVANFGRRPTFDGRGEILEVHLLDYAGDLYDRHLRVALIEYLRPEQRFSGIEALRAQIEQDAIAARQRLAAHAFPNTPCSLVAFT